MPARCRSHRRSNRARGIKAHCHSMGPAGGAQGPRGSRGSIGRLSWRPRLAHTLRAEPQLGLFSRLNMWIFIFHVPSPARKGVRASCSPRVRWWHLSNSMRNTWSCLDHRRHHCRYTDFDSRSGSNACSPLSHWRTPFTSPGRDRRRFPDALVRFEKSRVVHKRHIIVTLAEQRANVGGNERSPITCTWSQRTNPPLGLFFRKAWWRS